MKVIGLCVLSLLLAVAANVAGTNCVSDNVHLVADGRVFDFDFVPQNSPQNWYSFDVVGGRSYSVEVRQDYDGTNSDLAAIAIVKSNCATVLNSTSTPRINDTTGTDPRVSQNSFRVSFTAPATPAVDTYHIQVPNSNASLGRYVAITVSETTLFNTNWTTFTGFISQYGFQNTTGQPVNGTLTVIDTQGQPIMPPVSVPVALAPNGGFAPVVGPGFTINIPANHGGVAIFTHDGPPGAVIAGAFFINPNSNPIVIVPSKFEAVRERTH